MTTIVINKSESLSMVFTPENKNGKITKTQDAYKMVMDAVKAGTAEKTCDTDKTLMYNITQ